MDPVIFDISSDEGEPDPDTEDWISELLNKVGQYFDDSDDVLVLGEVKSKHKINCISKDLDDDCVILDCDPYVTVPVVNDSDSGVDDVLVVGERGQIACRDYPHSRSLCAKFPFNSTSHESYCDQCHCYVCDSLAPCAYWGAGLTNSDHCHATDREETWKILRQNLKVAKKRTPTLCQTRIPACSSTSWVSRQGRTNPHHESYIAKKRFKAALHSKQLNRVSNSLSPRFIHTHPSVRFLGHRPVYRPTHTTCVSTSPYLRGHRTLNPGGSQTILPFLLSCNNQNSYIQDNLTQPTVDSNLLEFSNIGQSVLNDSQLQGGFNVSYCQFTQLPEPSECSTVALYNNELTQLSERSDPSTVKLDFPFQSLYDRKYNPQAGQGSLDLLEIENWLMDRNESSKNPECVMPCDLSVLSHLKSCNEL